MNGASMKRRAFVALLKTIRVAAAGVGSPLFAVDLVQIPL
jgi:hypothetical protein